MTTCHQQICPHMHFNKCYAQRIRSIPVSIFPDPTIDSFTNVNVKCGKPFKSNIPTVAYQKFNFFHQTTNDERNFIKDFYMENYQQTKMIMNNNIVEELKEEMYRNSAYVLAEGATKDYEQFQDNRKRALNNARNRANSAYQAHFNHIKEQKQKDYDQNGYWLKKLFRKLQQVAKHIIQGNGQDAAQKQKQFLLSKSNLTANFLSQIKIRDPKNAYQILQQLRTLMQKKKLKFYDQKQEQQLNKSVTMSFTSEASQNTSQNSMLSEATSINQSNAFGEDQVVGKFWDFNQLKNKWKLQDIQAVKQMIRRVLSKKIIFDAQLQAVKKRRDASLLNQKIIQINNKQKGQKQSKQDKKKRSNSTINPNKTKTKQTKPSQKKQPQTNNPSKLTKVQQLAKTKIIQGGRFDAIGQKYMRNKTYSQIFKDKENDLKADFVETGNLNDLKVDKVSKVKVNSSKNVNTSSNTNDKLKSSQTVNNKTNKNIELAQTQALSAKK